MKAKTQMTSKFTLGLIVMALGSSFSPFAHSALSGQEMKTDPVTNQNMLKEMQKIKNSLANGDIRSANESLKKMQELAGTSRMYDKVIDLARTEIKKKEGVGTKVETPKGAVSKGRPLPTVPDISDLDIKAFDDAFDANNVDVAVQIFKKYPKTDHDSPKKTNFLNEATKALTLMGPDAHKALYGINTRTPIGAIKKAPELNKEPTKPREALYGTKTRTPQGAQISPGPGKEGDVSEADIQAFKKAYETDNAAVAESIISKYHRTDHDSPKKKEFLDLAEMQIQVMR
jgi:hypothetical protein